MSEKFDLIVIFAAEAESELLEMTNVMSSMSASFRRATKIDEVQLFGDSAPQLQGKPYKDFYNLNEEQKSELSSLAYRIGLNADEKTATLEDGSFQDYILITPPKPEVPQA